MYHSYLDRDGLEYTQIKIKKIKWYASAISSSRLFRRATATAVALSRHTKRNRNGAGIFGDGGSSACTVRVEVLHLSLRVKQITRSASSVRHAPISKSNSSNPSVPPAWDSSCEKRRPGTGRHLKRVPYTEPLYVLSALLKKSSIVGKRRCPCWIADR